MNARQASCSALAVPLQQRRKSSSRELLLVAAAELFCAAGYFAVSVEDIATAAGVSRMTFYRHFSGKPALALDLFRQNVAVTMPRLVSIAASDYRDHATVAKWIGSVFEADRASGQLLRVFIQANVEESDFSRDAQQLLGSLISELGRFIPAFVLDPAAPSDRRQWLEAWLLLYEILDQSNHAARGAGVAADPLVIEILADRFVRFVEAKSFQARSLREVMDQ